MKPQAKKWRFAGFPFFIFLFWCKKSIPHGGIMSAGQILWPCFAEAASRRQASRRWREWVFPAVVVVIRKPQKNPGREEASQNLDFFLVLFCVKTKKYKKTRKIKLSLDSRLPFACRRGKGGQVGSTFYQEKVEKEHIYYILL